MRLSAAARPHRSLATLGMTVVLIELFLAHRFFGFLTGDDVEVLEEAFRRAIGFPFSPWDIRSLFVPDFLVAPAVWVGSKLGVSDTRLLIESATLPFIALTALTIWLVYRLALSWTADSTAAIAAAFLFGLHWIPLGFGSTAIPERWPPRASSRPRCWRRVIHSLPARLLVWPSPIASARSSSFCRCCWSLVATRGALPRGPWCRSSS